MALGESSRYGGGTRGGGPLGQERAGGGGGAGKGREGEGGGAGVKGGMAAGTTAIALDRRNLPIWNMHAAGQMGLLGELECNWWGACGGG